MEVVGIIFIIGVFFSMWWMASGQEWLKKRRFKKLPEEEQLSILQERSKAATEMAFENLRKHEEFMKNQVKTPSDHYAHNAAMNDIKNNFDQSLKDYDMAIKLDPQNDKAYYGRAFVSHQLGNHQREIQDLVMAAKLGNQNAKDYLSKKKIRWE
jgi:tetratricopeptide (TPR) repeat protein